MPTVSKQIEVTNEMGLHARPAMAFVDAANTFTSKVTVYREGDDPIEADGKSVMISLCRLARRLVTMSMMIKLTPWWR